jgi:hypothetical protein
MSPAQPQTGPIDWAAVEACLHQDPGRRGLATYCQDVEPLDAGLLAAAAEHLVTHGRSVAILTGFCIAGASPPAAETDGPPSALYLGRMLRSLDVEVTWLTDAYGRPLLKAGCSAWNLEPTILEIPLHSANSAVEPDWSQAFFASDLGRRLTHLISIERAGPSHTLESLQRQPRNADSPQTAFLDLAPEHEQNVCHNMRGDSIDHLTAPAHHLFEQIAAQQLPITTIGVGDGGNEIGMGSFAWEKLVAALGPSSARIICRIATDYALIAGVSDWGGFALADAVAALSDRPDLLQSPLERDFPQLLNALVAAGAVDGVSWQHAPTVDGLNLATYLAVPLSIRRLLAPA